MLFLRPQVILLPGLPVSNTAASFVALRMRSGRLVKLPLASASRTASMFNRGGNLRPGIRELVEALWPSPIVDALWVPPKVEVL